MLYEHTPNSIEGKWSVISNIPCWYSKNLVKLWTSVEWESCQSLAAHIFSCESEQSFMHLASDAQGLCANGSSSSLSGYSHWTFSIAPDGKITLLHHPKYSSNSLITACRAGIGPARGKEGKLLKCLVKNSGMFCSKQLSIIPSAFGFQSSIFRTLLSKERK